MRLEEVQNLLLSEELLHVDDIIRPPSFEEIIAIIKGTKNGKAYGHDNITSLARKILLKRSY